MKFHNIYQKYFREKLPRRKAVFNSKTVLPYTVIGYFLHRDSPHRPHYESGIANSLRTWVDEGDSVVIVGGGLGVTAAIAAEMVGPNGEVHVFEGSEEYVDHVSETARLNGVADRVSVTHAIVGTRIDLRGAAGSPKTVAPEELPPCDVLELDCEGSEIEILSDMSITPRIAIVESHGHLNAPSSRIRTLLEANGYRILAESIADRESMNKCIEKDTWVLTGVRGGI